MKHAPTTTPPPRQKSAPRLWVTLALVMGVAFLLEWSVMEALPALGDALPGGANGWFAAFVDAVCEAMFIVPLCAVIAVRRHKGDLNQGQDALATGHPGGNSLQSGLPTWVHGVGAGMTVLAVGAVALSASWVLGNRALKSSLDEQLSMVAELAAQRLDGDAHAKLTDAAQQGGPEYDAVVAPLRAMREATPSIKYLYTVRNSPEGPRFVVDAADPGDHDGDGVEDQSQLLELYDDADPEMLSSLASGRVTVSAAPYTDKWGTFISAFAPVRRRDGTLECLVGVDMTAENYLARRAMMTKAVMLGGLLTLLSGVGIGLAVNALETRRRASDDAVRGLLHRKHRIATQVPGMLYQFRRTRDGVMSFPYASEKIGELFGVEPAAVMKDGTAIFATIHPDDIPGIMASIEESYRTLQPWKFEFRVLRAGAASGGAYRWLMGNSTPDAEPGGSVLWHGFVTDVTERRNAEELTRASLARAEAANADLSFQKFALDEHAIVAITDVQGRITYVNDRFCAVSRYSREELIGQDHRVLNSGYHPKSFFREMYATITDGKTWRAEVRNKAKDGTLYWVDTTIVPYRNAEGVITNFVEIRTDITARKEAEAQRAEQLSLSTALSAASDIREAALAVNDMLGQTTDLSRTAVLLFDEGGTCRFVGWRGLSDEYRAAVDGHCPWKAGDEGAEPIVMNDVLAEPTMSAYHDLFRRERIASIAFVPIVTNTGVAGKLMLYGDRAGTMTPDRVRSAQAAAVSLGMAVGRMLTREALARSEQRMRTVINTALDAVVSMASDGTVTEWNAQAERTFGWTRQEAVGRPMHELIIPADPPHLREAHVAGLRRYLATGEAKVLGRRMEVPGQRKDGSAITVELAISCVRSGTETSFSAFLRDVTEQRKAEVALRDSERTTRLLAEHTHDLVGLSAPDGRVEYMSPSVQRTLGYTPEDTMRPDWRGWVHPEDHTAMKAAHEANLRGEPTTVRHRAVTKQGGTVWLECTATPVKGEGSDLVEHVVWSSRDVTAQVEAERSLESMALSDRLTGLPNGALLHDRLQGAMLRAARYPSRYYAVLFLDFDRFKLVNDTLGHEAGDELLRQIAERLRRTLRATDTLARSALGHTLSRLGGDEFVVVLDDLSSPQDAKLIADRLISVLAAQYTIAGQSVTSSASIGLVLGDPRYTRPSEVLRDADTAMYEAKAAGRGRWVLFDEPMRLKVLRRAELERDLAGAGTRGELQVCYQPVVSLEDGAWTSMEALARWTHPRYGPVSPAEFIPIAEESDLIVEIGEWVFTRACADLAAWRRDGVIRPGVTVSVNLSRRQLSAPRIGEKLCEITRDAGLTPAQICIEITETAVMRDKEAGIRMLRNLRAQGFRLSLDDFGTGHSSLASLRELPLDAVKIDRSFVATMSEGHHNAAMMHALADLSRNLGMAIVAEGVETHDQVVTLQTIGCGHAQGYYFGKPMTADKIPDAARAAHDGKLAA